MGNNWNWVDKRQRAEVARQHTITMETKYREQIAEAVQKTIVYSPDSKFSEALSQLDPRFKFLYDEDNRAKLQVEDIDSVSAIAKYYNKTTKVAVLNFSSYKNPGGMFIQGSRAQEECLCHESFLYNVLHEKTDFYDWNNLHKNRALYTNRCLYTPGVVFERDGCCYTCDVITCAAPNKLTAQRYQSVSDDENFRALWLRIKFILDIAATNGVETLILGAYGCGVFGQDATDVAKIFKSFLADGYPSFKKVIFAISDTVDDNYYKFKMIMAKGN